jgi:phage FluMu protein Com
MPSLCKQDGASGYAYVKIKSQRCDVCKTVKSDDYLTVVFQKSFKGKKLDNQNSQEIIMEQLHVCPGCAIMGGDGQTCVPIVNSQIENNVKGSIDNSENLKTTDSKPLNVDVHNRNDCSPHNSGYLTVVFNDPKTKDLDKNEATCKNEKSSIRESIKSMSSQGEIGYPIMEESSEL